MMKQIIKREIRQGWDHQQNIINLYKMINDACENEFYEDNTVTMNINLTEWFEKSLRKPTR